MHLVYRTSDGNELWLGDWSAATDIRQLTAKNIRHVYTAAALDVNYPKEHGIIHKKIEAFDAPTYNMAQHFQSAYSFLKDSLAPGNVLVHCAAGVSRSATIVIMYLMKANGWELEKTISRVREKRPVIMPNPGFIMQQQKFEKSLKPTIQLKNEQNAMRKFLSEDDGRKTSSSFMSKFVMRQSQFNNNNNTNNNKNPVMKTFSTQKSNILPDGMKESKTSQLRSSQVKKPDSLKNSKLTAKLDMFRSLLKKAVGFETLKQPRIIKHNR